MAQPFHPRMRAVMVAYNEYLDSRDEQAVKILRTRANLAEAIQNAKKAGISLPKQADILGIDRTWVFRLSKGGLNPPASKPPVAMSRISEGVLLGTRSAWQATIDGVSEEEPNLAPPEPPELKETVIVQKIPDCRYCNNKATRVLQYGNGKTAMVCEAHAPEWKESDD